MSTPPRLAQVKHTIAISSAKGGVGKSTVAVNLALALKKLGWRVGLLDADIYGPSQHIMLGVADRTPEVDANKKIIPFDTYGIRLVSFGTFMRPEDAVIWRGPLVARIIQQFIDDVNWGELDFLVIDLPPGTGDAQLSLTQLLALSGAVIVTTPQDVALADTIKGYHMFKKVNVPVLGIIENMSYFECPHCNETSHIFSHGGGKDKAGELGLVFLGELPLEVETRICGDQGEPVVIKKPDSQQAQRFVKIAQQITTEIQQKTTTTPRLEINLNSEPSSFNV